MLESQIRTTEGFKLSEVFCPVTSLSWEHTVTRTWGSDPHCQPGVGSNMILFGKQRDWGSVGLSVYVVWQVKWLCCLGDLRDVLAWGNLWANPMTRHAWVTQISMVWIRVFAAFFWTRRPCYRQGCSRLLSLNKYSDKDTLIILIWKILGHLWIWPRPSWLLVSLWAWMCGPRKVHQSCTEPVVLWTLSPEFEELNS